MKTYPSPAVPVEWHPTGAPQTVTRLQPIATSSDLGPGDATLNVPQTLTFRGETTKRGMRRVVLRIESKLNNATLSQYGGTFKGPDAVLSAHLVVQMPEMIARQDGAINPGNNSMLSVVLRMVAHLIAVASNESPTGSSDLTTTGLLAQALQGTETLDVLSGEYGTKTV